MGGKSRKSGTVSRKLIEKLKRQIRFNATKGGRVPIRTKKKWDKECEEALAKMEDKIIERIKQDCEDWNRSLANANPEKLISHTVPKRIFRKLEGHKHGP